MTPLGLLSAIRKAHLHDDEARVLLAIGNGLRRYSDIRDNIGMKDAQLRKMARALVARGLIEVEHSPLGVVGRGKCSVYTLTGDGIGKLREILSEGTEGFAKRPLPVGVAIALMVKAKGGGFLQP
jgi:DNA-binding MarR family transcriptional regulator